MRKYTEEIFKVKKMGKMKRRKFFREKIAKREAKLKEIRDAHKSVVDRPKRESPQARNRRALERPITQEEIEKLKEDWNKS